MIDYNVYLNNGVEAFGVDFKTITAVESVKTADEEALAREISHENPLIPPQVAKAVLENFCKATAQLMSMGCAIQLKHGNDVAMRIYPDVHIKGGNINLTRAQELDPTVTELTLENAGDLASKAGIDLSVRAVCQPKFSELLKSMGVSVQRKDVIERDKILRVDDTNETPAPGGNGGGGNTSGGDNGGGDNGGGTTPPGGGGGVDQN